MVQLSHPYMVIGKTALTRWTFVRKVMSLLFNMLSRLVIAFLSRSARLLTSWLQSPSAMILEPKKIKSVTVSIVSPSICHDGTRGHDLCFLMLNFKPALSLSSFTYIKRFSDGYQALYSYRHETAFFPMVFPSIIISDENWIYFAYYSAGFDVVFM